MGIPRHSKLTYLSAITVDLFQANDGFDIPMHFGQDVTTCIHMLISLFSGFYLVSLKKKDTEKQ